MHKNFAHYIPYSIISAISDIKIKYKGSYLGPLWATLSIFAFALILQNVNKTFYNNAIESPVGINHIIRALVFWYYFSFVLLESSSLYSDFSITLRESNIKSYALNMRLIVKNFIIMLHNFLGLILYSAIFDKISIEEFSTMFFLLTLTTLPLYGLSIVVSILCTRFTDLKSIILLAMQVLFFLTPIFWVPEQNNILTMLLPFNIVAVLIEIQDSDDVIRYSLLFALHTMVYSAFALYVYNLFKKRIVFYL